MQPSFSACIITLNEESNISKCLQSLDFADDIVVVDSGSTDKTVEIAKNFGARVYFREFDNYINQKNYAISLAKNDWVVVIDADEEISQELKKELLSASSFIQREIGGFETPRLTCYLGKWIRHGGWYPNFQIKIFNRKHSRFEGELVHETVVSDLPIQRLKNPIFHYPYESITEHIEYLNRYSSLAAQQKFNRGIRSGVFKAMIKFLYKFIWTYFFRLGFLDGKVGFLVCFIGSFYNFAKYSKLFELEKKQSLPSALPVVVDTVHNVESTKCT